MKNLKKLFAIVIFGFLPFFLVATETSTIDFISIFSNSANSTDFSDFEKSLIEELKTGNPSVESISTGIFYTYFYNSSLDELSENQLEIKNLITEKTPNYYSVVKFFKAKANSSLLKKYDIGQGVKQLTEIEPDSSAILYISDSKNERMALYNSISEVEALNLRFTKMASEDESTPLRFSDEAYIKTSQNPSLVYVMENEPDYKKLYEAYKEAGSNIKDYSFGETPDAYYKLISMLKKLDSIAEAHGLVLSEILSPFSLSIERMFHTSPYVLTLLNLQQLEYVINEIDFMCNFDIFNNLILQLLRR